MKVVTIKTFDDSVQANIIRAKLEYEKIPCFLQDENLMSLDPLLNITVGGIKLQVHEADRERALQIVDKLYATPLTDDAGQRVYCPQCGSGNVELGYKSMSGAKGFIAILISILLLVFPFYFKRVTKCCDCDWEFKS